MNKFKSIVTCLLFVMVFTGLVNAQKKCIFKEEGFTKLFNGKDLVDWDVKIRGKVLNDDPLKTFHAEDGILKVDYANYGNFADMGEPYGHIAYKHSKFSHYNFRVTYRFVGEQQEGGRGWDCEHGSHASVVPERQPRGHARKNGSHAQGGRRETAWRVDR